MSNKAVSATYRMIIDDVIANVRQDFEDMGIEKEVLDELQRSWEQKIVATQVADFEGAENVQQTTTTKGKKQPKENSSSTTTTTGENGSSQQTTKSENLDNKDLIVKKEEEDNSSNKIARTNGSSNVHSENSNGDQQATYVNGSNPTQSANILGLLDNQNGGESSQSANKRKRPATDDNEIGSDLDDSDEDEMEGNVDADGNEDMILCLYDKVQRVRNKWKCVLRDGVASIDGRDYVFSKLSSELEW